MRKENQIYISINHTFPIQLVFKNILVYLYNFYQLVIPKVDFRLLADATKKIYH